ncbi:MAG: holo-ACP synthase [Clostridiales bacterium]|nr:holo-ACP synthase [Clostridiales bacterium]
MLGTDIIEIERIAEAVQKESFLKGVFTENERAYYASHGSRAETLAGLFCAKEAVAKALGCGFRGFRPCDIEIGHDAAGAPYVTLLGAAKEKFPDTRLCVSISHCKAYATAVVIVVSDKEAKSE